MFKNVKYKKYRNVFSILIFLIFVYVFSDYINKNRSLFNLAENINYNFLIIPLLLMPLSLLARGFLNIHLFNLVNINLSFKESLEIVVNTTLGNLIGPLNLGSGYKLQYFIRNYKVNVFKYLSLTTTFSIYSFLFFILLMFILSLRFLRFDLLDKNIFTVLIIIFFIISILIILSKKVLQYISKYNFFYNLSNNIILGIEVFLKNKKISKKLFYYFLLINIINFIFYWLIVRSVNLDVDIIRILVFYCGINLAGVIKITPLNFGVQELLLISIMSIHNLSIDTILIVSFLSRAITMIIILIFFIINKFITHS